MTDKTEDAGHAGHKRSLSGSLLSRFPFLRTSTEDLPPRLPLKREDEPSENDLRDDDTPKRGSAMANAMRQTKGRKRKGSLRKTAILGTGKLRERRNSILDNQRKSLSKTSPEFDSNMSPTSPNDETTPRQFSYEHPSLTSSSESGWGSPQKLSLSTDSTVSNDNLEHATPRALASPLTSPVGAYASTTDDDDGLSFSRPPLSGNSSSYNPLQLQLPGQSSSIQRRRSNKSVHSSSLPISHTPSAMTLEAEWDYSETEWWGWVVLIVTWIVFVVGMGSCLGVWSWAWDVGETPYAPPELEDDPTLPITGYYPALMVLTAVMAWVWVVVAWVGMKYFRHAKVVGEDG
ncbi:hypothetical protein K432DRAFT_301695 [Lepidopterella palustris CBS 459.81]|uniref:Uncharacterized protein n=1 Tax=Lepidopterella palustris CBS 459.81 TaxID=1314670 RepID=A0A8E2E770_9PEZI|nr:hypothetical protein K432DRAFT_301695 [Lepidopterella palustris CBS 459.81]